MVIAPDGHSWAASQTACSHSGAGVRSSGATRPSSGSWSNTPGAVSAHIPALTQRSRSTLSSTGYPFSEVTGRARTPWASALLHSGVRNTFLSPVIAELFTGELSPDWLTPT